MFSPINVSVILTKNPGSSEDLDTAFGFFFKISTRANSKYKHVLPVQYTGCEGGRYSKDR